MSPKTLRIALLALAWLLAGTAAGNAQILIKASDDVNFKLGVLGQFQADTVEDPPGDANSNNLFIRRLRLMFAGQVAKKVTFFIETDTPNLGKAQPPTGKTVTPEFIQDAYGEFKVSDAFALDAGLMFVPFSRNSLQSAATLMPIDYGAYTFTQSAPTQSSTGRDTGFQAKGGFLGNHLEYRFGAFQGLRDARSHNPFRYVGRLQYNFFDTDTAFFYTGTYAGKKRVLAVGTAFDSQKHYRGYDVDAFLDYPVAHGAITGQFDFNYFDGGETLTALPKQHNVLVELGYLFSALKLTPVFQFTSRDAVSASAGDETRWSAGLNYWWAGHNANIKSAYSRISPTGTTTQNEFTVQLQLFYF
jgi:phosphate-selective porin O/P